MDGRDIGTIVFPNAHIKFFIDADIDIRAERRFKELYQKGDKNIKREDVKANLLKRDHIDSNREHSPLKIAHKAILINTENLSKVDQLKFVIDKVLEYYK
jgi:cytidylate kinase